MFSAIASSNTDLALTASSAAARSRPSIDRRARRLVAAPALLAASNPNGTTKSATATLSVQTSDLIHGSLAALSGAVSFRAEEVERLQRQQH